MDAVEVSKKVNREHGYTLVEVMVAALILGLGIIGAISMLRMAREMEYEVHLRRQARLLATSYLEDPFYAASKYLYVGPGPGPVYQRVIDPLPNPEILATVSIYVYSENSDWPPLNGVASKKIVATVTWPMNGVENSVVASKRISKIKKNP